VRYSLSRNGVRQKKVPKFLDFELNFLALYVFLRYQHLQVLLLFLLQHSESKNGRKLAHMEIIEVLLLQLLFSYRIQTPGSPEYRGLNL
jgi:hypothetical protein